MMSIMRETADKRLLQTLFMYDCYMYGDFVAENVVKLGDLSIPDDFLIMCYAPHTSRIYIERSLSDMIISTSREYSPSLDADSMVLFSKSYGINISGKKISVFITYSMIGSEKMADWIRTIQSKHAVFDTDVITLSRNGISTQKLSGPISTKPNPFVEIFNRCAARVYTLTASEEKLESEKMKEMILSRIYDKKIRGWKNNRVLSKVILPDDNMDKKCPICLEQIQKDSLLFNSGSCSHVFHLSCMDKLIITDLIKSNVTKCPCCRVEFPISIL